VRSARTPDTRAIDHDEAGRSGSEWAERDPAIIFTVLLAGLRSEELIYANVADIRATEVIHVRGKGNKVRRIPLEHSCIAVVTTYLESWAIRFPGSTKRRAHDHGPGGVVGQFPLFVASDRLSEVISAGSANSFALNSMDGAGNLDRLATLAGSLLEKNVRLAAGLGRPGLEIPSGSLGGDRVRRCNRRWNRSRRR
jgi:hypothetical protein